MTICIPWKIAYNIPVGCNPCKPQNKINPMNKHQFDDGGPAFPNNDQHGCAFAGMTLRDWFAGQASEEDFKHHEWNYAAPARQLTREQAKYAYADAMIAARNNQP